MDVFVLVFSEKKYVEYKSGKYQYISTVPITDETIIGGSDACQVIPVLYKSIVKNIAL